MDAREREKGGRLTFCQGTDGQEVNEVRCDPMSSDGHAIRISAEGDDVVMQPTQDGDHVVETVVPPPASVRRRRDGQEA